MSALPIIGDGPPGTFVLFPNGLRVSLPTDQIVFADDTGGHARVGFGGMRFAGMQGDHLVFARIRDLLPEDQLSPARSHTMRLEPQWVTTISVNGRAVWARGRTERVSELVATTRIKVSDQAITGLSSHGSRAGTLSDDGFLSSDGAAIARPDIATTSTVVFESTNAGLRSEAIL